MSNTVKDRGVYANILLDDWFKRAFKEYGNAKRLMLLFLQALIPEREIASIDYASEESINQNPGKKSIRVDVECYDKKGQRFVVEVQHDEQDYFYDRAVFNSTFAVQRQLQKGTDSYQIAPVYFIGIMRFVLQEEDDRFLFRYSLTDDATGAQMTDDLHYIFLETPKCRLTADATLVEKLGYALYNLPSMVERPSELEGEIFDLLFCSANLSNFAPAEKIKYQNDVNTERDIRNQIAFAREKGIKQGLEQGLEQGREEGRQEGRQEGVAHNSAEIARKMLGKGYSPAEVQELTGLSAEEIAALKETAFM